MQEDLEKGCHICSSVPANSPIVKFLPNIDTLHSFNIDGCQLFTDN